MEKLQGTTQHHQQPAATAQPLHEKQLPLHQQQQQQQLHHEKEAGHGHIESSKTTGALETAKSMAATGPIYTKTTTYGAVRHCQYTPHPNETMQAAVWSGTRSVSVATVPRPILSSATDAIVDITATCICGSDLHFYNNVLSGSFMQAGDILGHEAVGIVREVGGEVHNVKVGDRVVISAIIACGKCEYCKKQQFSLCDSTNPSQEMADMYGYRLSGVFGYSSLTGGYAGLQAEVARVPFADANLLKISNDSLSDEQIVLLSDVLCTAWHGLELSNTNQADTVCIWGCGPIGLMSSYLAKKVKHAYRVLNIDNIPYRLNVAKKIGCETVNFDEHDVIKHVKETVPGGPDVCIDCVGFRFPKSTSQKFMFKTGMQTDAVDCVREAIVLCKKGGNISLIGDYFGTCNEFPVGALMEKSLTVKGGQLYCQRYWKQLLSLIESGEIDPTWLLSHRLPFQEIEKGYEIFNARKDNCTKIVLFTKLGQKLAQQRLQHLGSSGGGEGGTGGFVLSSGSTSSQQEHHHAMSQLLLTRHQEEVHDGKPCPPSCNFAKGMATSSGATNVGGGGTETATGLGGELPRK